MKIRLIFLSFIFILVSLFFKDLLIKGNLPIPADTIVGLYYPYKDFYAKDYPRGIPFKNFLITDPIRQQYPWKKLTVDVEKRFELPLWNPYNFSGTPHLANFQSAAFSPFNLIFFIFPFSISWSILIFLQPVLAAGFLFLYLDNLKLRKIASLFGAVAFAFSGFSIAWMEWGNILATAMWLPLIFLAIDKIFDKSQNSNSKSLFSKIKWPLVFILSGIFSLFSGHLQIFFYLLCFSIFYILFKWALNNKSLKTLGIFIFSYILFFILSLPLVLPALQLISLSARNIDQGNWMIEGWFIPLQNIVQFIVPDFFGNPATLNYFGVWNYGEFIGYIGIAGIVFAFIAILLKRDKTTLFFLTVLILSLVFAFDNFISKLPFRLSIPFISTSQPTRLIFIVDFTLSILAAFGLDYFLKEKRIKKVLFVLVLFFAIFIFAWVFVLIGGLSLITSENLLVAKRNLIFPTVLLLTTSLLSVLYLLKEKVRIPNKIVEYFPFLFILVLVFDLFRFGLKFLPFTTSEYLYPSTKIINFLQENKENFRVMETNSEIFPPNFSIMHKIQSVDGYDPLFLLSYAQLMAAIGRQEPNISPPFGFNRIITPQNYNSKFINLLGVKYVLSHEDINEGGFSKVMQEGKTKVYENGNVLNRAFFVQNTVFANSRQNAINIMFDEKFPLKFSAVVEGKDVSGNWSNGSAQIVKYEENKVEIVTKNYGEGFLILTDSYYPTWKATIDGKLTKIYLTDYNFRGILIPKGEHKIIFYANLF